MQTADRKQNRNIVKRKAFKHEVITEQIIENIRNGNLAPGDKLPSLRQLSQDFQCNYLTVYRSFKELESMGLIEKRTGSGSYIKQTALNISSSTSKSEIEPLSPTNKIGVLMVPGSGGPYMHGLMEALHRIAEEKGLSLNLRTVSKFSARNITQIQSLKQQECCAVIIPMWPKNQDLSEIHKLISSSLLPIVLPNSIQGLEKHSPSSPVGTLTEDKSHTVLTCEYFQALGYRNIALLGTDQETENGPFQKMMIEYTRFVNSNRLPTYIGLVDDLSSKDYDLAVSQWKHLAGDLAVICYHDEVAIRLMIAIHKQGLSIPEDIAVLGYNNIADSEFSDPPLSTLQCPYDSMAEAMILHALSMCGDNSRKVEHPFSNKFIIRESCGGRLKKGDKAEKIASQLTENKKI